MQHFGDPGRVRSCACIGRGSVAHGLRPYSDPVLSCFPSARCTALTSPPDHIVSKPPRLPPRRCRPAIDSRPSHARSSTTCATLVLTLSEHAAFCCWPWRPGWSQARARLSLPMRTSR
jgi:hypothetical protein